MFHRAAVDIFWLGSLPTRILGWYSDYYVAWRGNSPLFYHPSPLISHPLPAPKSMQNMVKWSIVEHELKVTRHPKLGTKGDMGLGFFLCWDSTPGLGQGQIKVISRSNQLKYWIKHFFTVSMCFCCREVFHKATVDIMWLGSFPTRILEGGGVQWVYVAWRGNTQLLYHESPLISPPLPALTSVQNEVNWSHVEHGLQVTKHLRHPHLGTGVALYWGSTPGSG